MSSFQELIVEVFYTYILCGTTECCIYSDLIMYVFRLGELESELSGTRERVIQLQGEKEKALADLNNIRKINRTIEKSVHIIHVTYSTCHIHEKKNSHGGARQASDPWTALFRAS